MILQVHLFGTRRFNVEARTGAANILFLLPLHGADTNLSICWLIHLLDISNGRSQEKSGSTKR